MPWSPVSGRRSGRRKRSCNERVREEQGASRRDCSPVLFQDSRHRRSAVQLLRAVAAPREGDRALDGSDPPEAADSRLGRWEPGQRLDARGGRHFGLELLIERGTLGMVYNIAPQGRERTNLEVARSVATVAGSSPDAVYLSEYDRPLHDRRYAIDASRIRKLGWRPVGWFDDHLRETVDWYRLHPSWWEPLLPEAENLYSDELESSP